MVRTHPDIVLAKHPWSQDPLLWGFRPQTPQKRNLTCTITIAKMNHLLFFLFLWLCECLMMWPTWTGDQQLTRRNTEKSLCVLCPLQRGLPEVSGLLYLLLHLRFLHNTLYCKIKNFLYLSILQNQKNFPQCCWQKKLLEIKKNFNCRGSKRGGPITRSPEHHLDLAITTKEMWRMRAGGKRISWLFLISWGANPGDSWPNTANLGFLLELEGGVQPSVQKPGSHPKK